MTRQYKDLRASLKRVILNIGDIVIDNSGGHVGILIKRRRHIDIIRDDIYVWEVKWINNVVKDLYPDNPAGTLIEEEGLRLSIVAGSYEWHSINGETYEL
jgi:hypothetical protein|tara:strand:+ start:959 stop:1258 length:300 start_codon:yes stop_codon:yes gene_type:complete